MLIQGKVVLFCFGCVSCPFKIVIQKNACCARCNPYKLFCPELQNLLLKILRCSYKDCALTSWQHSSYIRTNSGKHVRVSATRSSWDNLHKNKTNDTWRTYIYIYSCSIYIYVCVYAGKMKSRYATERGDECQTARKMIEKFLNCRILNVRTQSILFTPLSML